MGNTYKIPEVDFIVINEAFPERHSFGHRNESLEFIFDTSILSSYDFDYDEIFNVLFGVGLLDYLSSIGESSSIKIIKYIPDGSEYKSVNYDLLGLYKEKVFLKGELTTVYYRAEFDENTQEYSNLVVREDVEYVRDANKYIYKRIKDIVWLCEDESECGNKRTVKYYSPLDGKKAGTKKRVNQIDELEINAVFLISQTEGVTISEAEEIGLLFINKYINEISKFTRGKKTYLYNAMLQDDEFTWLDNPINSDGVKLREYLYSELQE